MAAAARMGLDVLKGALPWPLRPVTVILKWVLEAMMGPYLRASVPNGTPGAMWMDVMAAGVHHAAGPRSESRAGLLLDRQGVDIRPQGHIGSRPFSAAQKGDGVGLKERRQHFQRQIADVRADRLLRLKLLPRDLGDRVQFVTQIRHAVKNTFHIEHVHLRQI